MELNKKTRIYTSSNNFVFLGRNIYGGYAKYRTARRKFKKMHYLYKTKVISLNQLLSSSINYKNQSLTLKDLGK